jgi:hypothetical protein
MRNGAEASPSDSLLFERDQWDPTPRLLRVSAQRGIRGHRQLPQPLALRALGHHGHGPERLLAYPTPTCGWASRLWYQAGLSGEPAAEAKTTG